MTNPTPPRFTGDAVTRRARPQRVSPHKPLRDRLAQTGAQHVPLPEQVIGALAVVQGLATQLGDRLDRLEDSPILWSGIVQLGPDGTWQSGWKVQYRCVAIANLTTAVLTVAPGGVGDPTRPPASGAGVHQCPANAGGRFAIAGNSLVIYGPVAGFVDVTVASRWVDGL